MKAKAWVMAVLVFAAGCDGDSSKNRDLVVWTQNTYYGFDVNPLLAASDPAEIPILTAQAYQQLVATDMVARADALAAEIARRRPHLVGLQEVSLIRVQSPGDAIVGGTIPAETVLYDYLDLLLTSLAARGEVYKVAGKVQNVDVELPMLTDPAAPSFDDIRLTDFDVVLAREDVTVSDAQAVHYAAKAVVPSLGLEIPRGYVAVTASTSQHRAMRFVTTHLEDAPFFDVQAAQVQELAAALAGEKNPVVLAGDFNSPAPTGDAYVFLSGQGYIDAWTKGPNPTGGATWGHDADLANASDTLTQRIDFVWVRPTKDMRPLQIANADLYGDTPDERTPSGLWVSDHAGVIIGLPLLKPAEIK